MPVKALTLEELIARIPEFELRCGLRITPEHITRLESVRLFMLGDLRTRHTVSKLVKIALMATGVQPTPAPPLE